MASVNRSVKPSVSGSLPAELFFSADCTGLGADRAASLLEGGFLEGVLIGVTKVSAPSPAVLSKNPSISLSGTELCNVRKGFSDSTLVISS